MVEPGAWYIKLAIWLNYGADDQQIQLGGSVSTSKNYGALARSNSGRFNLHAKVPFIKIPHDQVRTNTSSKNIISLTKNQSTVWNHQYVFHIPYFLCEFCNYETVPFSTKILRYWYSWSLVEKLFTIKKIYLASIEIA